MTIEALPDDLKSAVQDSKILLVGAGGIGCEVLKNLVTTGFKDIEVIDLDTIDVSNLNRQFLFQRRHVGQSKSRVACDAAASFCNADKQQHVQLKAHHDSIIKPDYGVTFFRRFSLVLNALDNRAARSHVNRLCLAADVALVESGTAGYLGQTTVIKKGVTECYECQPKPAQKTYPGCTIRNTPSEPIHCIVWAKHLFNQLFGEDDPDEDVSPDTADPELAGDLAGVSAVEAQTADGNVQRVSTRGWAEQHGYDARRLFVKLFSDDIKYLLSMDRLWQNRRPPQPLDLDSLIKLDSPPADSRPAADDDNNDSKQQHEPTNNTSNNSNNNCSSEKNGCVDTHSGTGEHALSDQRVWTPGQCCHVLISVLQQLRARVSSSPSSPAYSVALEAGDTARQPPPPPPPLVWDKDDDACLDFVVACANLRAHCFNIQLHSRFSVKSMAGNIIPAIATTNAIIAGLLVLEAFKILEHRLQHCRTVYLNQQPNFRGCLLAPCQLEKPNPKCYVCADKPEVSVRLDTSKCRVSVFVERVLQAALHMSAPDVEIDDARGVVLVSSEPHETEAVAGRCLADVGVQDGTRLICDDFLQDYQLRVNVIDCRDLADGVEFELVGDVAAHPVTEQPSSSSSSATDTASAGANSADSTNNNNNNNNNNSSKVCGEIANDDDAEMDDDVCVCLSPSPSPPPDGARVRGKRAHSPQQALSPTSSAAATAGNKRARNVSSTTTTTCDTSDIEVIEL